MQSNKFIAQVCALVVEVAEARMAMAKFGGQLKIVIAQIYASVKSEKEFITLFGNGKPSASKEYIPGTIADEVRAHVRKMHKDKQKAVLDTLKTRLSEARRAYRAGLTLGENEDIQQAVKRIPKESAAQTAPASETETVSRIGWAIPKGASLEDVVEQFSVWVGHHPDASRAVATALADCLPISVKAVRKAG